MSFRVISKAHLDALVNSAARLGVITTSELHQTGVMLWQQNVRSVNAFYGTDRPTPGYSPTITDAVFQPAAIVHLLSCYEFNSGETTDWEQSAAFAWCRRVLAATEATMPAEALVEVEIEGFTVPAYMADPDYGSFGWEMDSLDEVPLAPPTNTPPSTNPEPGSR